jgi:hypothetical protein
MERNEKQYRSPYYLTAIWILKRSMNTYATLSMLQSECAPAIASSQGRSLVRQTFYHFLGLSMCGITSMFSIDYFEQRSKVSSDSIRCGGSAQENPQRKIRGLGGNTLLLA